MRSLLPQRARKAIIQDQRTILRETRQKLTKETSEVSQKIIVKCLNDEMDLKILQM